MLHVQAQDIDSWLQAKVQVSAEEGLLQESSDVA